VLNAQVFMNLLLELAVGMNLVGHDNFLDEGLVRIAFSFNASSYRLLSPCRDCACVGFCVATRGVMRAPSYEGAAMAQTLCLCRSLILFRRVESGAGLILIASRDGKLSATLAKNAWRSGRNISLTVVRIRSPVNVFLSASRPVGATIRRCYIFSHSKWSSNLANYVGQSHHRRPMLAERMAVHFFRLPSHHSRSVRCS
jgi:hypothetical protein